jgi:hypothetical protein
VEFQTIYSRTIKMWPEVILLDDGYPISTDKEHIDTPSNSGGFYFPTLDRIWAEVEDKIDHSTDTWGSMMVWTMFQVFHTESTRLLMLGRKELFPASVQADVIEARYFRNLHAEGWEEELRAFERRISAQQGIQPDAPASGGPAG